jgi:hypothetical protein
VPITPHEQILSLSSTFSSPQIIYWHAKTIVLARHCFLLQKVSLPLPRPESGELKDVFGTVPDDGTPTLSFTTTNARVPLVSGNPDLWRATEADLQS